MAASFIVSLCTSYIMSNRSNHLSSLLQSLGTLVHKECKFQEKLGIHSLNNNCIRCMREKTTSFQFESIVQARQPFKQGRDWNLSSDSISNLHGGIGRKEDHRSGKCLRNEPEGLDITLKNREVEHVLKQARCWNFCKKLQGGHAQVTKEFALNFTGLNSKVGMLELHISPDMISTVTEIPRGQESWFKNFKFDMNPCKEFLKQDFINLDLRKYVPRSYVKESYAYFLTCI